MVHGQVLPVLLALFPKKTQAMYEKLLDALFAECGDLGKSSVMLDFEQGAYNAFKRKFPSAPLQGCFFYLCENVYKHAQTKDKYTTGLIPILPCLFE